MAVWSLVASVLYKSCRTPVSSNVRLFAGITWPQHVGIGDGVAVHAKPG